MKMVSDVRLYAEEYALALRKGPEGGLLVMNFMTGSGTDMGIDGGEARSNTLNPFAGSSIDQLKQRRGRSIDETR